MLPREQMDGLKTQQLARLNTPASSTELDKTFENDATTEAAKTNTTALNFAVMAPSTPQTLDNKNKKEEITQSVAQLGITQQKLLTLIFSKRPRKERYRIHILGDSISQGLLPAPRNEFVMDILNGLNAEDSWPYIMEQILRQNGITVTVANHSESGRRLTGRTDYEGGKSSLGEKDGRVALQSIVSDIINKHSESDNKIIIMTDLGTNDLHEANLTTEYLKGSLIKNILTILTDSNLQFKLLRKIEVKEQVEMLAFIKRLNKFVSEDIRGNHGEKHTEKATLSETVVDEAITKKVTHGEEFEKIINENRMLIQKLFSMIAWKIVLIPAVEVIGHPFGKEMFASAELSKHWATIVKECVEFFDSKNIFAVENAQKFVTPHHEEFGGCVHFDEKDNLLFGQEMAKFLLSCPQLTMQDELRLVQTSEDISKLVYSKTA